MTHHNYFPLHNIGLVNGIENSYLIHWLDTDTAEISLDGDEILTFCSQNSGGFLNELDVLDQARDIVAEWDAED